MAGSVNKVILLGNVGQDPDVRSFQSGDKVANISLATSESWKDRNTGERQERTEWHRIAVFGDGLVGVVEKYVKKGSKIYVEGQLRTRKWQDQEGNDRYSTEIVLSGMGGKLVLLGDPGATGGSGGRSGGSGRSGSSGGSTGSGGGYGGSGGGYGGGYGDDLDDDIPF